MQTTFLSSFISKIMWSNVKKENYISMVKFCMTQATWIIKFLGLFLLYYRTSIVENGTGCVLVISHDACHKVGFKWNTTLWFSYGIHSWAEHTHRMQREDWPDGINCNRYKCRDIKYWTTILRIPCTQIHSFLILSSLHESITNLWTDRPGL